MKKTPLIKLAQSFLVASVIFGVSISHGVPDGSEIYTASGDQLLEWKAGNPETMSPVTLENDPAPINDEGEYLVAGFISRAGVEAATGSGVVLVTRRDDIIFLTDRKYIAVVTAKTSRPGRKARFSFRGPSDGPKGHTADQELSDIWKDLEFPLEDIPYSAKGRTHISAPLFERP